MSLWLCWIIFTRCNSIILDFELLRTYLMKTKECSLNCLLVYTTVLYVAIDILYHLCKAFTVIFKSLQFTQVLLDKLQSQRILLILAVHFLFVRTCYFMQVEFKDPQTETLTLCGDNFMSATLTVFKNSQIKSFCIDSLYNSMFWTLLFIDLTSVLLFHLHWSSCTRYSPWMIDALLLSVFENKRCQDTNFKLYEYNFVFLYHMHFYLGLSFWSLNGTMMSFSGVMYLLEIQLFICQYIQVTHT